MKKGIAVAVMAALFARCEKGGPTVYGPFFGDVDFQAGRVFIYAWSSTMVDSWGNILRSEADTVTVVVTGTDVTLDSLNGLISIDHWSNGYPRVGTAWYRISGGDFVEVAYRNPGGIIAQPILRTTPVRLSVLRPRFSLTTPGVVQMIANEIINDSVQYRRDPRVVYRSPLAPGASWVSFTDPFQQTREVKNDTTIWILNEPYPCVSILTRIPDFSPSLDWYDFVNQKGLIRRTITFPGLLMTDPDNPEVPTGTATLYEFLEPISIEN